LQLFPEQLYDLTPSDLIAMVDGKRTTDDLQIQSDWNRMRILYSIIYNSNVDQKHRKEPHELMPFSWDETKQQEEKKEKRLEEMTAEERMRIFEKMDKRVKEKFGKAD